MYQLHWDIKLRRKKDIVCNDDINATKLTVLWSCIECIQESSVYFIQQVKMKKWPKEVIPLTITASTCIKISDENMQKSKISLKELISYTVIFPPNSIQLITSGKNCPQCGRVSYDHNSKGKLFKCTYYHVMTLAVMYCLLLYVSKLEFKTDIRKSVTIYYQQIAQYFDYKKKPVPQYLNNLVINRVWLYIKIIKLQENYNYLWERKCLNCSLLSKTDTLQLFTCLTENVSGLLIIVKNLLDGYFHVISIYQLYYYW